MSSVDRCCSGWSCNWSCPSLSNCCGSQVTLRVIPPPATSATRSPKVGVRVHSMARYPSAQDPTRIPNIAHRIQSLALVRTDTRAQTHAALEAAAVGITVTSPHDTNPIGISPSTKSVTLGGNPARGVERSGSTLTTVHTSPENAARQSLSTGVRTLQIPTPSGTAREIIGGPSPSSASSSTTVSTASDLSAPDPNSARTPHTVVQINAAPLLTRLQAFSFPLPLPPSPSATTTAIAGLIESVTQLTLNVPASEEVPTVVTTSVELPMELCEIIAGYAYGTSVQPNPEYDEDDNYGLRILEANAYDTLGPYSYLRKFVKASLRQLNWFNRAHFRPSATAFTALVENAHSLRYLHLDAANVTDQLFAGIGKLSELGAVCLANCTRLTPSALKSLSGLPKLRKVVLKQAVRCVELNGHLTPAMMKEVLPLFSKVQTLRSVTCNDVDLLDNRAHEVIPADPIDELDDGEFETIKESLIDLPFAQLVDPGAITRCDVVNNRVVWPKDHPHVKQKRLVRESSSSEERETDAGEDAADVSFYQHKKQMQTSLIRVLKGTVKESRRANKEQK